jgi:hypothetical protein
MMIRLDQQQTVKTGTPIEWTSRQPLSASSRPSSVSFGKRQVSYQRAPQQVAITQTLNYLLEIAQEPENRHPLMRHFAQNRLTQIPGIGKRNASVAKQILAAVCEPAKPELFPHLTPRALEGIQAKIEELRTFFQPK